MILSRIPGTRHEQLEVSFKQFDQDNPQVYEAFKKLTFSALDNGDAHASAGDLFQDIRSDPEITTESGDQFKINQNFSPFYAQKLVKEHPCHSQAFKLKKQPSKQRLPRQSKTGTRLLKPSKRRRSRELSMDRDNNRKSA